MSDDRTCPSLFAFVVLCICQAPTKKASCCSVSMLQACLSAAIVASPCLFVTTAREKDWKGGETAELPAEEDRAAASDVFTPAGSASSSWSSDVVPVALPHLGTSQSHFVRLCGSLPTRGARCFRSRGWPISAVEVLRVHSFFRTSFQEAMRPVAMRQQLGCASPMDT